MSVCKFCWLGARKEGKKGRRGEKKVRGKGRRDGEGKGNEASLARKTELRRKGGRGTAGTLFLFLKILSTRLSHKCLINMLN